MKKSILLFGFPILLFSCVSNTNSVLQKALETYNDVRTKEEAIKRGGYWYKGKCWANFSEDESNIAPDKIDSYVDEQMELVGKSYIELNDEKLKFESAIFKFTDQIKILLTFIKDNKNNSVIIMMDTKDLESGIDFEAQTTFYYNYIAGSKSNKPYMSGILKSNSGDMESMNYKLTGDINIEDGNKIKVAIQINISLLLAGTSTLSIDGNQAFLDGILGTRTYKQIKDLVKNHKDVDTIVLGHVPGSLNDDVNMYTGRLIREYGLVTKVLSDSKISSGGVDIFCAGAQRIVTKGAKIGVHSWLEQGKYEAIDLPKDHPAHQYQINYFNMCLGDLGEDFYFYTLNAAPADSIYWMKEDEIKRWTIATELTN